jgi:hypothetical protein
MGGARLRPRSLVCWPIGREHPLPDRYATWGGRAVNVVSLGRLADLGSVPVAAQGIGQRLLGEREPSTTCSHVADIARRQRWRGRV